MALLAASSVQRLVHTMWWGEGGNFGGVVGGMNGIEVDGHLLAANIAATWCTLPFQGNCRHAAHSAHS